MSAELSKKWDGIGKEILSAARTELYLDMRFLDVALSSFKITMDTGVRLAGTDGYTIYFEPYSLAALFETDRRSVNRLYLHMVLHCLFFHLTRRGDRDRALWDIACDIAVESMIDGMEKRTVKKPRSAFRSEICSIMRDRLDVLTPEGIYAVLTDLLLTPEQAAGIAAEFAVDDHGRWPAPDEGNVPPAISALNDRWKDISEKTQTRMEFGGSDQSKGSSDMLERVSALNKTRRDYSGFLRRFAVFREEMAVDMDEFDTGFYSYGLRLYGNMPLIEPREYKESKKIQDLVVAVDTSMSCSGDLVRAFIDETCGVLLQTESYFKKVRIHIIQCDEDIREDKCVTSREELEAYMDAFELKGGGGTDFRPVFAYADSLVEEGRLTGLKGLIYFTDGKGIYPSSRPKYDTAFVFMEGSYDGGKVPPWAMKLVLSPERPAVKGKNLDKDIKFVYNE